MSGKPVPGEHHFASIYLAPKIFKIKEMIPEYINPDGTKKVNGDLVYGNDIAIEIKFRTIIFTKNQINIWIKDEGTRNHPTHIIGINENGLFLQNFKDFRENYIRMLKSKKNIDDVNNYDWKKYSPKIGVDEYLAYCKSCACGLQENEYFPVDTDKEKVLEDVIANIF